MSTPGKIFSLIPKIMSEIGVVGKDRTNSQGSGYKFRGIDDMYNAIHGPLSKYGVFFCPTLLEHRQEERQSKAGGLLIYTIVKVEYKVFADDGSYVTIVAPGEAMDSGDKSTNKAMSGALKYAMLQLFCIPTEEPKDSENETPEVAPRAQANIRPQAPQSDALSTAKPVSPMTGGPLVTEPQLKRLFAIMKSTDWLEADVRAYIHDHFGLDSTRALNRTQYDMVIDAIQSGSATVAPAKPQTPGPKPAALKPLGKAVLPPDAATESFFDESPMDFERAPK